MWPFLYHPLCPFAKSQMVRDDPKLSDDGGEVPKPNGVVGGSIPVSEIISLLDEKLTMRIKRLLQYVPEKGKKKKHCHRRSYADVMNNTT